MKEYSLILGPVRNASSLKDIAEFEHMVNAAISMGWEPLGGICYANGIDGKTAQLTQAFLKEKP